LFSIFSKSQDIKARKKGQSSWARNIVLSPNSTFTLIFLCHSEIAQVSKQRLGGNFSHSIASEL